MTNETISKSYDELKEGALKLIDKCAIEDLVERYKKNFVNSELFLQQIDDERTAFREETGFEPGVKFEYPEVTQPLEYFFSRVACAIVTLTLSTKNWRDLARVSANKTQKEKLSKVICSVKALLDGPDADVYNSLYYGKAVIIFDARHLFDGTIDSKASGILASARPLNLTSIVDLLTETRVDLGNQETGQPVADPERRGMSDADLKRRAIRSVFTAWHEIIGEVPDLGEKRSGVAYPLVRACLAKAAEQAGLSVTGKVPFATDIEKVHADLRKRAQVKRKASS